MSLLATILVSEHLNEQRQNISSMSVVLLYKRKMKFEIQRSLLFLLHVKSGSISYFPTVYIGFRFFIMCLLVILLHDKRFNVYHMSVCK